MCSIICHCRTSSGPEASKTMNFTKLKTFLYSCKLPNRLKKFKKVKISNFPVFFDYLVSSVYRKVDISKLCKSDITTHKVHLIL